MLRSPWKAAMMMKRMIRSAPPTRVPMTSESFQDFVCPPHLIVGLVLVDVDHLYGGKAYLKYKNVTDYRCHDNQGAREIHLKKLLLEGDFLRGVTLGGLEGEEDNGRRDAWEVRKEESRTIGDIPPMGRLM